MPKVIRRARITPVTIAPVMDVSGFMAAPSQLADVNALILDLNSMPFFPATAQIGGVYPFRDVRA
jgi:hypothetical protein